MIQRTRIITTDSGDISIIDTSTSRTPDDRSIREDIIRRGCLIESYTVLDTEIGLDLILLYECDRCRIDDHFSQI